MPERRPIEMNERIVEHKWDSGEVKLKVTSLPDQPKASVFRVQVVEGQLGVEGAIVLAGLIGVPIPFGGFLQVTGENEFHLFVYTD